MSWAIQSVSMLYDSNCLGMYIQFNIDFFNEYQLVTMKTEQGFCLKDRFFVNVRFVSEAIYIYNLFFYSSLPSWDLQVGREAGGH